MYVWSPLPVIPYTLNVNNQVLGWRVCLILHCTSNSVKCTILFEMVRFIVRGSSGWWTGGPDPPPGKSQVAIGLFFRNTGTDPHDIIPLGTTTAVVVLYGPRREKTCHRCLLVCSVVCKKQSQVCLSRGSYENVDSLVIDNLFDTLYLNVNSPFTWLRVHHFAYKSWHEHKRSTSLDEPTLGNLRPDNTCVLNWIS